VLREVRESLVESRRRSAGDAPRERIGRNLQRVRRELEWLRCRCTASCQLAAASIVSHADFQRAFRRSAGELTVRRTFLLTIRSKTASTRRSSRIADIDYKPLRRAFWFPHHLHSTPIHQSPLSKRRLQAPSIQSSTAEAAPRSFAALRRNTFY